MSQHKCDAQNRAWQGRGRPEFKSPPLFTRCAVPVLESPGFPLALSLAPSSLAPPSAPSCGHLPEAPAGSQNPGRGRVQWAPLAAWAARLAAGSGPGRLGPRGVRLQPRSRVPDAPRQGLGSRGLFAPLWQMVDVGSRRNRPKIVPATQTFRRHQCTPLCNNTNFVAAEKSLFSPLKRAPAASGSFGRGQLLDCSLPSPSCPLRALRSPGPARSAPDPRPGWVSRAPTCPSGARHPRGLGSPGGCRPQGGVGGPRWEGYCSSPRGATCSLGGRAGSESALGFRSWDWRGWEGPRPNLPGKLGSTNPSAPSSPSPGRRPAVHPLIVADTLIHLLFIDSLQMEPFVLAGAPGPGLPKWL